MPFYHKFHDLRILVEDFCRCHLPTFSANFFGWWVDSANFFTFRMYGLGKCPMIIGILITHGKSILYIVQTPCSRGQHRASYIFGWYNCHLTIILGPRFTIDIWRDPDMKRILSLKDFFDKWTFRHCTVEKWNKLEIRLLVCLPKGYVFSFSDPRSQLQHKSPQKRRFSPNWVIWTKYCWSQI